MERLEVHFNEYNVPMENTVYFPIVSGLLRSYAETIPAIRERYRFMPFLFMREHQDEILKHYRDPSVAAFSVSMWNLNLSLEVARRVKDRFPRCLVVFGGPSVPFAAEEFSRQHPFVDVTVRGEGEQTFADILVRHAAGQGLGGAPGISYRGPDGAWVRNAGERELPRDLDLYPSPYLSGVYDDMFAAYPHLRFQAIVETNRGCPYTCSYCFWGQGGLSKRFRFFSLDRIRQIADWCGRNRILYVFCADSNFGVFPRDLEIARALVEAKVASGGYPEKFRVCYAKNAEKNVFEIGRLLHSHDMEKGITLSRQTNSAAAAANVGRKNIRMEVYTNLQRKYNREGIPVYTELILGLPGESYESFRDGIEEILQAGIKNQLFVYFCQVYPNTELADPGYRRTHGIRTIAVPLNEIHGAVRPSTIVTEHEEIIIGTSTMDEDAWKRSAMLSWVMQTLHGLKLGFFVLLYLVDRHRIRYTDLFERLLLLAGAGSRSPLLAREMGRLGDIAGEVLQGKARGQVLPEFGNVYWDVEEGTYLRCVAEKDAFFDELSASVRSLLDERGVPYDRSELAEVIAFQKALVPGPDDRGGRELQFTRNIPQYFDTYFLDEREPLADRPLTMSVEPRRDFAGDRKAFAMEVVMFGRKSAKMLHPFTWQDR